MRPRLRSVVVALAVRRRLVQDTLYGSWLRRTGRLAELHSVPMVPVRTPEHVA